MYIELVNKYRKQLMGVAALWILIFHVWKLAFTEIPKIRFFERVFVRIGFCGVDIFFLISGIGLVYAIGKYSLLEFWVRRYKRLIFPFVLILGIIAYLEKWDIVKIIKVTFGYGLFFGNYDTVLWFTTAIAVFYLLFPLYYRFFSKSLNPKLFTVVSLEIWAIIMVLISDYLVKDVFGLTNRIPIFLIGVLLGWMGQNEDVKLDRQNIMALLVTLMLGLVLSYLTNYCSFFLLVPVSNCCIPNILITVSLCPLLALVIDKLKRKKILCAVLGFLGLSSYELYCAQAFWGKFFVGKYVNFDSALLNNAINMLASIALGTIIYFANSFITKRWHIADFLKNRMTNKSAEKNS